LTNKAEQIDNTPLADGYRMPDEIARRADRLKALEEARRFMEAAYETQKAKLQVEYEAKMAERQKKEAQGKTPRGKPPQPPSDRLPPKTQRNFTDPEQRIMKAGQRRALRAGLQRASSRGRRRRALKGRRSMPCASKPLSRFSASSSKSWDFDASLCFFRSVILLFQNLCGGKNVAHQSYRLLGKARRNFSKCVCRWIVLESLEERGSLNCSTA